MQPQGPDSDHIKTLVNWVVGVFGQIAVREALRVDAETLEAVLAGSLEASADFRERLAQLIETADAAGLGRPPAMPDVPNAGPEVVSPGPSDLEVPSTQRTSGDHPVQKPPPAKQPPVPSSPSPRETLEKEAETRELQTLFALYNALQKELNEFEKSKRYTRWQRLSIEAAELQILLTIAIVHGDNARVEWAEGISREGEIARLRENLRDIQGKLSTWPGGFWEKLWDKGPYSTARIIRNISANLPFPEFAVDLFLLARILQMGEE